jgi:hypothetical protein
LSNYASKLQKEAMRLAMAGFGTRFKSYRNTPAMQVQPGDLPMLGVYILREKRQQDTQANIAEPRFLHELTLGFSGAVWAETDDQNRLLALEEWMSELDEILLTNARFVKMTEGITTMDRQSQYAKVGETTLFEIRVEMTIPFRSYFPPKVEDMLERVHVTSQYPDAEHVESGTPQIIREYELETE